MSLPFLRPGFWFAWHRRLGLAFVFALMLWSFSGILHPIISRLGPTAVPWQAGALHTMNLPAPADLECLHGVNQIGGARLFSWQGRPVWQFMLNRGEPRRYCDAQSGALLPNAEPLWVQDLARKLVVNQSEIVSVERVVKFGPHYPQINRILPVYHVRFADGVSAYVDPDSRQLTGSSNAVKGLGMQAFRILHTWAFLPHGLGTKIWMTFLLIGLFAAALLGCCWLWRIRQSVSSRPRYVQLHAWLGLILLLPFNAWLVSGLWHIWAAKVPTSVHGREQVIAVSSLKHLPMQHGISELVLLPYGEMMWRSSGALQASGEHDHQRGMQQKAAFTYFSLAGETLDATLAQRQLAENLSRDYQSAVQIKTVELVTRYGDEYGFIFKRLPVLKVALKDQEATVLYLDPVSGALAAQINRAARWEGYAFSWLHKGHWVDAWLNKTWRDSLLALGAALLFMLGLLGLIRGLKGKK